MKNKKVLVLGILIGLVLVGFTVYFLLDTFVFERVYQHVPPVESVQDSEGDAVETPTAVIDENTYQDDNISISLTHYREYDTDIHVADVRISSPEYLKTAFAKAAYGRNVKAEVSETAESVNAILAINGDYYGARESGYVVRNGVPYRNTLSEKERDILVIYKDGSFETMEETEKSVEELVEDGAEQVFCFGPALVRAGEIVVSEKSEKDNPRTAIGLIDDLHYVFVVTDGRVNDSKGLTYHELAEFVQSLGATEAYNLDGGGSSSMYFNGRTVNEIPEDDERKVSDIVYIGY